MTRDFEKDPLKILSLDGGGTWALLQAMALKNIYSSTTIGTKCRNIVDQFDIIVANSGGSLVLAALIENLDNDIEEVFNLFDRKENRDKLFSPLKFSEFTFIEMLAKLAKVGPKYKASRKIDGILSLMPKVGHLTMNELRSKTHIKPELVICGFDYDMNSAVFFKTKQTSYQCSYRLSDAINAASNAPVNFFDEPVEFKVKKTDRFNHRFWDGAVGGNNNPILIGITEALKTFENCTCSAKNIKVLSIGTGNNLLPVESHTISDTCVPSGLLQKLNKTSLTKDIAKMATSILSEPPTAANYMAHVLLGGPPEKGDPSFIRLNALIQPQLDKSDNTWKIPEEVDISTFLDLVEMEMDAVEQPDVEKIKKLGHWWMNDITPNQSISYDKENFESKIGHSKFSDAKNKWIQTCKLTLNK